MAVRLMLWLPADPGTMALPLAWLLTYSLHALAWAAAASALAPWRGLHARVRQALWRAALFGPLATALVASLASGASERAPFVAAIARPSVRYDGHLDTITLVVFGAAALGVLRFAGAFLRLRRTLRDRSAVTDPRWLEPLEELRLRMGLRPVRLTQCRGIDVPLVAGACDICVPHELLSQLGRSGITAVLAHELAHLERRDGFWFPATGLVANVLWFQPLNLWVAARVRESAELACDDRAVELTRDPRALARTLLNLAEGNPRGAAHRAGMLRASSGLARRVESLVRRDEGAAPRSRTAALCGLAVALTAMSSIAVSVRVARAQPNPPAPDALALGREMMALARREHDVQRELDALRDDLDTRRPGTRASVHALELEQQLSHLRATALWTEERFTELSKKAQRP